MGNRLHTSDRHREHKPSHPASTNGRRHHRNHHDDVQDSLPQQMQSSQRDKLSSCPDLVHSSKSCAPGLNSVAKRAKVEEERKLEFKIYRSFTDLADSKQASFVDLTPLELKVYRRSTDGLAGSGRTQSLPRGMERMSHGGGSSSLVASQDLHPGGGRGPSRTPSSCSGGGRGDRGVGDGGIGGVGGAASGGTSRRTSMRSSVANVAAHKVTAEDFPDTPTIRLKLAQFESLFLHCFLDKFQRLPPLNQLSSVAVALRPDRAHQYLSLLQYLESDSIPADLEQQGASGRVEGEAGEEKARREFNLTVSPGVFERLQAVKRSGLVDQRLGLAKDIAAEIARHAAAELSRMFEYQLSLIHEPVALQLLARHAIDCVYDVMKRRQRLLDKNTVVQAAVRGRPRDTLSGGAQGRKLVSVIVGCRELKWNIFDVFKRPGLRKDLFAPEDRRLCNSVEGSFGGSGLGSMDELQLGVQSREGSGASSREDLGGSAWRFYTSAQCDQMVYGYRGQIVEWDFVNEHYRLSSEDEGSFPEEVSPRYDDFHRLYTPYIWLIGIDIVQDYFAATRYMAHSTAAPTLIRHVKHSRSTAPFIRSDIKLAFRPLQTADDIRVVRSGGDSAAETGVEIGNAAMEITRACDALRFGLEEIDELRKGSNEAVTSCCVGDVTQTCGGVLIHVTRPAESAKRSGECGGEILTVTDL